MTANPFDALGIGFDATKQQIRTTYLTLTKKYHPSRFARMERPVVKLANEVFLRVKDAYVRLSDEASHQKAVDTFAPKQRTPTATSRGSASVKPTEPTEETEETPSTRRSIAPGTPSSRHEPTSVRTKRPTPSRQTGSQRRPRPPSGAQEIAGGINDTVGRRNEDYEMGLKMIAQGRYKAARTLFHKVAAEDPKTRKYRIQMHFSWGLEHEDGARFDEARKEFERALNIDPEFKRAHEALDRLPRDKKGSGFFSKIFGR